MDERITDLLVQVSTLWSDLTGQALLFWGDAAPGTAPEDLPNQVLELIPPQPSFRESITWQNQSWLIARVGQEAEQICLASLQTSLAMPAQFKLVTNLLQTLIEGQLTTRQLHAELTASRGRLNFLSELVQITFQTFEPAQLYPRLAQTLGQVIDAEDICLIFLESEQPQIYTASGRDRPGLEKLAIYTSSAAPLIMLSSKDSLPRPLQRAIPDLHNLVILPMPLTGELRGLVALINYPTNKIRPVDQQLLGSAVELISVLINSQLARHAQEANRRLDLELSVASQIQASFLPTTLPEIPELEFAASLLPAHLISGDFYDVQGAQDRWAIMVGDVAGKGIPAAMLAAMIHATLKSEVNHHSEPAQLLQMINRLIYAELDRSDTFITAFLAVLQTHPLRLHYASAGHTTTLLWRSAEQKVLQLPSTGMPLGIFPEITFDQHYLPLDPNDILMLYSDGITEAENDQGRVFGGQALIDLLLAGHPAPIDKQLQLIFNALDLHRGKLPLRDDVVLLMVRARGPQTAIQVQPFVFTAEKRNVRALATQIRQVASGLSFSTPAERNAFLNDLELAVSEIATNIVVHAYRDTPYMGRIQGRVTTFSRRVQVDLIDSGVAYQPAPSSSINQPNQLFSTADPPTSGYGLAIARRLLDVCVYTRLPEGRNHWRLEKLVDPDPGSAPSNPKMSTDFANPNSLNTQE